MKKEYRVKYAASNDQCMRDRDEMKQVFQHKILQPPDFFKFIFFFKLNSEKPLLSHAWQAAGADTDRTTVTPPTKQR